MTKTFNISSQYELNNAFYQSFYTGYNIEVVLFDAADVNGDGLDEFILAGHNSRQDSENPTIIFHIGDNLQLSVASDIIQPGPSTGLVWARWVLTEDFNSDGYNDVFIAAHGFDYEPWPGEPNLLLLSDGNGSLTSSPLPYEAGEFSHSAASGDIDGDGDLDIYVGNVGGQNILPYLLLNDGHGAFTLTRAGLPASLVASDGRNTWDASMYDTALLNDFDGDGSADLALGNFSSSATDPSYIYFNNGSGGFSDTNRKPLPNPAGLGANSTSYDLDALDVDGDGDLDLINIYTPHDDVRGWEIQLLINDGRGNFSDETSSHFRPGETSQTGVNYFLSFLDLIDINNDGFLDLVAKYLGTENAKTAPAFWLNDGSGNFAAITNEEFFPTDFAWLAGRQFQPVVTSKGVEFLVPFELNGNLINNPITLSSPVHTGPNGQNPADFGVIGFNELYYLNHNPDVLSLVDAGVYANGLSHYLNVGAKEGRLAFADGTKISGTDASDIISAVYGNGRYELKEGDDQFLGSSGNEFIIAGGGSDRVNAGAGNDSIWSGAGNDTVEGGAGNDVAFLNVHSNAATVQSFAEGVIISSTEGLDVISRDVEEIHYIDTSVNLSSIRHDQSILSYGASYGDLVSAFGMDAMALLRHFADHSAAEGRTITFDGLKYIASYGDLINAFGMDETAGLRHFIHDGYGEGREVTFDGLGYIASYGDLISAFGANGTAGTQHFIQNGFSEGRNVTFNALTYIASYGDLIQAFRANEKAGSQHFIENGFSEGRQSTFDAARYLSAYDDLQEAFGDDLKAATVHYINYGFDEGRVFI